jgi:enoyl-CoA hydratase/carnithine racemase
MSQPPVSITYQGPIAIITLNKPQKLNSLNKDEFYSLATLLREADARPEILVTLLIGTGRFFSASVNPNPIPQATF